MSLINGNYIDRDSCFYATTLVEAAATDFERLNEHGCSPSSRRRETKACSTTISEYVIVGQRTDALPAHAQERKSAFTRDVHDALHAQPRRRQRCRLFLQQQPKASNTEIGSTCIRTHDKSLPRN